MPSGGGGSKQVTSQTQTSTPFQKDQFGNLLEGADKFLQTGLDKEYGGRPGFDPVADMTPEQQAALKGQAGLGQSLADLYGGAGVSGLSDILGSYDPSKTGLGAALGAVNRGMDFNFETQVNPQIRQGAQGAGQFGSSRHGIAEGLARSQLSQQKLDVGSQMAFQDQQAFNQQRLAALGNLSGISQGLGSGLGMQFGAGQTQQEQAQREIQGELEAWAYENNVPLNDLIAYKNLISGEMGGTTTGKTTQKGGAQGGGALGMLGTIGGGIAGSFFGPMGTAIGSQLGGAIAGGGKGGGGQSTPLSSVQASRM